MYLKNKIANSDFLRHNAIFFAGTLAIAVFNYLYYPVISRLVDVATFGEIQAIISIFMQLGILLTAFGYAVTHVRNNSQGLRTNSDSVILKLEKITLTISLLVVVVLATTSYFLKDTLQFSSALPFVLVGVLVIINIPSTTRTYVLQADKRLKEVSVSGIIFAVSKLVFSVILILAGVDAVGVMLGYIFAQLLTVWYLSKKSKGSFPDFFDGIRQYFTKESIDQLKLIKREIKFAGIICLLLFGITLLYSFDVVIARMYLTPYEAGLYSGISSVARIVFFVTASISGVLIASVTVRQSAASALGSLKKSMVLLLLIGGGIAIFFSVFPMFSLRLLLGTGYESVATLLPLASLLMLTCALNNLLVLYQIARRSYITIIPVIIGFIILATMILTGYTNMVGILWSYLTANAAVFVILVIQILVREKYAKISQV
ncbi:hypothetical protein FJZ39_03645 [Candidatus Saccharibacteria bacterium]|nr:hypothetical protein [Candidatus Saccharibacteria bacterium]